MEPPLITPPKTVLQVEVKYAHAMVKYEGEVFTCLACGSIAADMDLLQAVQCAGSQDRKRTLDMAMLQREHEKLERLQKLRLLQVEEARLHQLKERRDFALRAAAEMAASSGQGPKIEPQSGPPAGLDNTDTQPLNVTDSQIVEVARETLEVEKVGMRWHEHSSMSFIYDMSCEGL